MKKTLRILAIMLPLVAGIAVLVFSYTHDFSQVKPLPQKAVSLIDTTGDTLSPENKREFSSRARDVGAVVYVANAPMWEAADKTGTVIQVNVLERRITVKSDDLDSDVTNRATGSVPESAASAIDTSLSIIEDHYKSEEDRIVQPLRISGALLVVIALLAGYGFVLTGRKEK